MTDHTQDVREIAEATIRRWKHGALNDGLLSTNDMRSLADAVLSAVTPKIEEQAAKKERERIAQAIEELDNHGYAMYEAAYQEAAAVARKHVTPPQKCWGCRHGDHKRCERATDVCECPCAVAVARSHALPEIGEDHELASRG